MGQILSLSSRFTFATGEILSSLVRSFESNDATALQLYSPANDNGRLVIAAGIFMNSGHDHEDDEGGEKKRRKREKEEEERKKSDKKRVSDDDSVVCAIMTRDAFARVTIEGKIEREILGEKKKD